MGVRCERYVVCLLALSLEKTGGHNDDMMCEEYKKGAWHGGTHFFFFKNFIIFLFLFHAHWCFTSLYVCLRMSDPLKPEL